MKLTLVNFRSFDSMCVEFNDKTTLVSGQTGCGKSTLFMAMVFAVTGEGKHLVKANKKTCKVIFETNDIVITRSKGPNRLLVVKNSKTYEDKEGQSIIDATLPQWILGYIPQRIQKSFFAMTSAEKLTTIQNMCFDNDVVEKIRDKCKKLVNERKDLLKTCTTTRIAIENVLEDLGETQTESVNVENVQEKIAKTLTSIKKLETEIVTKTQLEEKKRALENRLKSIPENDVVANVNLDQLVNNKNRYNQYTSCLKSLQQIPKCTINKDELFLMINDMTTVLSLLDKTKEFDEITRDLNQRLAVAAEQCVDISCPTCFEKLDLRNGNLVVRSASVKTITAREAINRDQAITACKLKLESMIPLKQKLTEILEMYPGIVPHKQLTNLQSRLYDLNRREELQARCDELKCTSPEINVDDVLAKIKSNENNDTTRRLILSELSSINTNISKLDENALEKLAVAKTQLDQLLLSEKSMKYKSQWDKIKECKLKEKELEKSLPNAVMLQSLVKYAEELALNETIENINLRASIYMTKFFDTNVTAKLVFDGKVELEIFVNDVELDAASLSGGEYARATLAFSIAMAEMNNCLLLLLDECTSSLDSHTTEKVLDAIGQNFNGQVVIIAHQIPKGGFDKVIEL